ncbi:MAG TPA: hypothetical protein VK533_09620 [Sphingomonas sp.]|uniref:hypothetical protein n=1 Tax=Sphingomonas sp. TaxID=28214 RepID=UPI002B575808|nr:hypothetical protein [Sphingomonas sp.]HMI19791.1 hypothetical protein [Sphingomonas sp.]
MAYWDAAANEALGLAERAPVREIRLGAVERELILRARRDAQAHRPGTRQSEPRLEALRLYAMLGRYRRDVAPSLIAAGFSPAERRVIDAMLDALPMRARAAQPATGRLVVAILILIPLLVAAGAFGWASIYVQDRLIAVVIAGLAVLLLTPIISGLHAPSRNGS